LFLARRGPAALEPPTLVADDQVQLERDGNRIQVKAPGSIRGKIEVRGVGIVEVKSHPDAQLALVVDLVSPADMPRMPESDEMAQLLGVEVPLIRLTPWEASAPIKLAIALARARRGFG
jgi:serine kinase of HPr protein (carbohydrate metabolism regulator)